MSYNVLMSEHENRYDHSRPLKRQNKKPINRQARPHHQPDYTNPQISEPTPAPSLLYRAFRLTGQESPEEVKQLQQNSRLKLFYMVSLLGFYTFAKDYPLHPNQLLRSYGTDATLPATLYMAYLAIRKPHQINLVPPAVSFGIGSAAEGMQYLKLWPGTYDPKDFLAYGVGTAATYLIAKHNILPGFKQPDNKNY